MESARVTAVRDMIGLVNRGEFEEVIARYAAEDIELDNTRSFGPDQARVFHGREGARRFWDTVREPWRQLELVADELAEVGEDAVVVASHTRNVGRSGIEVPARGAMVFRFRDGRLWRWQLFQSKDEALDAAAAPIAVLDPRDR